MWAIGKLPTGFAMSSRTANGFTLIEALVVVAISALIAGIAFPSVERMLDFWRCAEASTAVRTSIEQARATALRSGVPVRFTVRPDGRSYMIDGGLAVTLPANVRFQDGASGLEFFSDGGAHGGSIHLIGARRSRWFTVTSDTGLLDVRS